MKRHSIAAALLGLTLLGFGPAALATPPCPALLNREAPRLQDEKPQNLCQYAGQVVVVVNTASFCGYTPQYASLEALYARYRTRGLVVLGFPSNDFGAQEPGSAKAIAELCENTFGVKFPMFAKSQVTQVVNAPTRAGKATSPAADPAPINPLFADLTRRTGQAPKWNFHKYLIGRDGLTVISHPSQTDPMAPAFLRDVEKLLDAKL
ncbi:MAG: glutathione peroxidase [Methylibium sp. NZG]|nr:MAG: glutathione peroxidase [Methylibium sp. NZG]